MMNSTGLRVVRSSSSKGHALRMVTVVCLLSMGQAAALVFAQLTSDSEGAAPRVLTGPSVPVPASYFGMHIQNPSDETWPQVPFSEWRLWDARGTVWYNLEPQKGKWNFAQLDRYVAMAESRGVHVLLTLGQTPRWATPRPSDPPAWRPGAAAPPINEEDWREYALAVATRYRGRIHEYEIWNEPNLPTYYSGSIEQLVQLSRDAYEIIHHVDPSAIVVSPSVTGWYGVRWLDKYLSAGGGKYADVLGYHFYSSPNEPESSLPTIQGVFSCMRAHGLSMPVWNTETGYSIASRLRELKTEPGSLSRLLTQQEALAFVMRSYLLNWASGVQRLYWYNWDGDPMAVGDDLGREKKPAALGYAAVRQWMTGATLQECHEDRTTGWECTLTRSSEVEKILWTTRGTVERTVPKGWKAKTVTVLSPEGEPQPIAIKPDRRVFYSEIPVLIH